MGSPGKEQQCYILHTVSLLITFVLFSALGQTCAHVTYDLELPHITDFTCHCVVVDPRGTS